MSLISFDYRGALLDGYGLTGEAVASLKSRLCEVRSEVLGTDMDLYSGKGTIPARKLPLDAGFLRLPERMLEAYRTQGPKSELGRILNLAKEISSSVDRVVVLGIGGSYMGARALLESCAAPYFNELSRGERGGYPRMYFEGNNVDNDASSGLLKLLGNGKQSSSVDDRWALVVISKSGGTLETAVAFRQFYRALESSLGGNKELLSKLTVPVTGNSGKLFDLSKALGCKERFEVPDGVGGRFSVLSAVGLLPAALLGLNVIELLEGAVEMNKHFADAEPGSNAVLDYVGVMHLLEQYRGINTRVLSAWTKSLESAGLWYDQLLAESLGKDERGALPLTVVNTRDLHSRAQQHQEGRRDKVYTNLIVDKWRTDPLSVGKSSNDQDQLNELASKTLPDIMTAAIAGTNQAYREDGRPTVDFHFPMVNERYLGQFFQLMMLATVVEGRLIDINPYGQPGVELYKKNMNRLLRS